MDSISPLKVTEQRTLPTNPFDFANPVTARNAFIGRDQEIEDIEYYLDYAKNSPRSINLAMLGERAAGKTSLLNIVQIESANRGLIPVRIDLNQGDVFSGLVFWFKIFDSIFNKVLEHQDSEGKCYFGGMFGTIQEMYLQMISTYEIPEDVRMFPFLFPVHYAKAQGASNVHAPISDAILGRDLRKMSAEVDNTIILLIDECNVMSQKRSLLEMLRNTFMNLPGYMLVFTGTPDLFPLMDEVFSPIVRQFKRISVSPFADIKETYECIRKPLESCGVGDIFPPQDEHTLRLLQKIPPEAHLGVAALDTLHDLHSLTAGRPYEIQLVCHFMYKALSKGKIDALNLDYSVLEDVLEELRQGRDDVRPIVTAISSLKINQLELFRILSASAGYHEIDQLLFFAEVKLSGDFSKEEILQSCSIFEELKILTRDGNRYCFGGDDFDRIVCKYMARQKNINLLFEGNSAAEFFETELYQILGHFVKGRRHRELGSWYRVLYLSEDSMRDEEEYFSLWNRLSDGTSVADFLVASDKCGRLIMDPIMRAAIHGNDVQLHIVSISKDTLDQKFFYCSSENGDDHLARNTAIAEFGNKIKLSGGDFHFETKTLTGSTEADVVTAIIESNSPDIMTSSGDYFSQLAVEIYLEESDRPRAAEVAKLCLQFISSVRFDKINSIGYILLMNKDFDIACDIFESCVRIKDNNMLAVYNLAVARACLDGNSIDLFRSLAAEEASQASDFAVLARLVLSVDNRLDVEEVRPASVAESGVIGVLSKYSLDILEGRFHE